MKEEKTGGGQLEPILKLFEQRCYKCTKPMPVGTDCFAHTVNPVAVCKDCHKQALHKHEWKTAVITFGS